MLALLEDGPKGLLMNSQRKLNSQDNISTIQVSWINMTSKADKNVVLSSQETLEDQPATFQVNIPVEGDRQANSWVIRSTLGLTE